MELRIANPGSRHLLILVHGLNGSFKSWEGTSQRFIENLQTANAIQPFDVYLFQYPTTIFQLTGLKKVLHTAQRFLRNKPKEDVQGFNTGIGDISKILESDIRDVAGNYDTISFIAHSMGGLVVKSAICWMPEAIREKVRLVISLSVPHLGANMAKVRKLLFGKHPQLVDLKGMGEFTTDLNRRYANLKPQPRIYYQTGKQDTVVCEAAAIPGIINMEDTTTTQDNHFSVLLIKDPNQNHLFRTILRELTAAVKPHQGIDIGIAEGTNVGVLLGILATRLKIQLDLTAFTAEELAQPLRQGNLSDASAADLIGKIGQLTIGPFPLYTVEEVGASNHYIIKKINP